MFASLHVLNLIFADGPVFARSGLVYYFVGEFLVLFCMYVSKRAGEFSPESKHL